MIIFLKHGNEKIIIIRTDDKRDGPVGLHVAGACSF